MSGQDDKSVSTDATDPDHRDAAPEAEDAFDDEECDGDESDDADGLNDAVEPAEAVGPADPDQSRRRRRRRSKPVVERKKLSQMLTEIAEDTSRDRVSVDDIIKAMHGRAFGALLLIFGFPNALPAPPGTSGILGLPLLYLSSQMMLGRTPWLPKLIAARSMTRSDFGHLVERVTPWLGWAERFMAPRLQFLVDPRAEKLLGAFCLILSMVLVLPIPLGNMLPAFAICLIALGVLERDGLWIMIGIGVGSGALVIVTTVLYALLGTATYLLINAF